MGVLTQALRCTRLVPSGGIETLIREYVVEVSVSVGVHTTSLIFFLALPVWLLSLSLSFPLLSSDHFQQTL